MTSPVSPELAARISEWRQKSIDGTLSIDEMREAVDAMRQGRVGAAHASEQSKRAKAKAVVPSAEDLLDELGGL
jgi:hypothetical protein